MSSRTFWIGEAFLLNLFGRLRDRDADIRETAVLVARVDHGHVERFDRFPTG